jgi:hypothetical protein
MRVPGDASTEVAEPAAPLRIFINYRRGLATPYARQLYEELTKRFGAGNVFWDIDTIQPGTDFVEFLRRAVGSCQVMVSVIGPGWLEAVDRDGRRRLDNPEDFVRLELEAALDRNVRIIPVLVGDATVPRSSDLPASLVPFVRRNAMEVTDSRWDYDVGRLLRAMDRIAEEERQKAEADAAAARAEAEAAAEAAPVKAAAEAAALAKVAADARARAEAEERAKAAAEAQAQAEAEAQARARAEAEARAKAEAEARERAAAEAAAAAAAAQAVERAEQERAKLGQAPTETFPLPDLGPEPVPSGETAEPSTPAPVRRWTTARVAAIATPVVVAMAALGLVLSRGGGTPSPSGSGTASPTGTSSASPTGSPSTSPTGPVGKLDSLAWTPVSDTDLAGTGTQKLNRVVAANGLLVAVGTAGTGSDLDDAAVWASTDGSEWSRVPDDPTVFGGDGVQEMNMVLAVGDGFLAVGENGDDAGAWTSSDGEHWARVDSEQLGEDGDGKQVINRAAVVSGDEVIAVGYESFGTGDDPAAVWSSPDGGSTWTRLDTADAFTSTKGARMRAVAVESDGRVVAGGFDGVQVERSAVAWTFTDAEGWSRTPDDPGGELFGGDGGQEIATIIAGPDGYVAVGEDEGSGDFDAAVWTSPDGSEWTKSTSPDLTGAGDQRLIHVLGTTSGLMAVGYADEGSGQDGAVWISENGTDWTRLDEEAFGGEGDQIMRGMACMDGKIVIVGKVSDHAAVWTADGATC